MSPGPGTQAPALVGNERVSANGGSREGASGVPRAGCPLLCSRWEHVSQQQRSQPLTEGIPVSFRGHTEMLGSTSSGASGQGSCMVPVGLVWVLCLQFPTPVLTLGTRKGIRLPREGCEGLGVRLLDRPHPPFPTVSFEGAGGRRSERNSHWLLACLQGTCRDRKGLCWLWWQKGQQRMFCGWSSADFLQCISRHLCSEMLTGALC